MYEKAIVRPEDCTNCAPLILHPKFNVVMKNIFFTCFMCSISLLGLSQEKSQTTSTTKVDTTNVVVPQINKPKYIDTGNPEEDQKKYDEAKGKYIEEQKMLKSQNLSIEEKTVIENKIKQIDSHINSINIKAEYILKNPDEKKIADEQGWFEDMKATKEKLELKKKELQKILDEQKK